MSKNEWKVKKVNLGGAIIGCFITLVLGVLIGLGGSGFFRGVLPYLGFSNGGSTDWSGLDSVYSVLEKNYDGELTKSDLIEGAKRGLVDAVGDDYTVYMSSKEADEFQKSLHGDVGAGVGIEMGKRDGYVRVIRTLPDNPARKAGVLSGDIIYKVDGEEVYSLSTDEIAQKVRGSAGSEVTLTVVREGEEKEFKMKREQINNVSVYVDYSGTTAILTVTRFDTNTGTEAQKLAKEFKDKGVKKVILDLRGNGGGYVSAAKDLLSLWIDGEKVLTQKSSKAEEEITYANKGWAILANMKTIVLIDDTTASASEITAGALQDYKKATIVGTTSFGKGVVQTMLDLNNNAMLKVTTAHWYTPNGTSINKTGVKPDVEIENTYDDVNKGRDPQMDKAKSL